MQRYAKRKSLRQKQNHREKKYGIKVNEGRFPQNTGHFKKKKLKRQYREDERKGTRIFKKMNMQMLGEFLKHQIKYAS